MKQRPVTSPEAPSLPWLSRRALLKKSGAGFGSVAMASMMLNEGILGQASANDRPVNSTAARDSHFPAQAKRVIWLFINGGPSHVDTWDYKPSLTKWNGKSLKVFDASFKNTTGFFKNQVGNLMQSPFKFTPRGQCGKMVSEIFPHLGEHVDKMAFLHAGYSESNNHSPALFMMNTGMPRMGFPCLGSWVTYGLGSESQDLPSFVVMSDPKGRGLPKGHAANWGAAFLPGVFQGTHLSPTGQPIDNLVLAKGMMRDTQRAQLDYLRQVQIEYQQKHSGLLELAARTESFELAFRMQAAAPEAINLAAEPKSIHQLYGIDNPQCAHFGRQCLVARRMVERGVRFVQIYSGGMENQRSWDGHADIQGNHRQFAGETDRPIAGLLADLQQRGMLEDTLVIWGGEFGRLPIAQTGAKPGRDHNPHCFSYWLAGGGVRGGVSYGESDEVGYKAEVNRTHINDLHATILHLLGVEHERLTYRYNGRDFRLTDVAGRVIHEILKA